MPSPRVAAFGRSVALWIGLCAALAAPLAWGNDRPFQIARTAVLEDDENVWSF